MRQTETAAISVVGPEETAPETVFRRARETPDVTLALRRDANNEWESVSCQTYAQEVCQVASMLIGRGIQLGDRVAIMANTSYVWALMDYGIMAAGGVTVPIYETDSADQINYILNDSGVVAVLCDKEVLRDRIQGVIDSNQTQVRDLWCVEDGSFAHAIAEAEQVPDAVQARMAQRNASDLASIIYTSGTTGRPKGCMISHRSMLFQARATSEVLGPGLEHDEYGPPRILNFLPLAHTIGRLGVLIGMESAVEIAFSPTVQDLVSDLATLRPTLMVAVPRVFEKIYTHGEQLAIAEGKRSHFHRAARAAISVNRSRTKGEQPKLRALFWYWLYGPFVYKSFRDKLGGRLRWCFAGGAPLSTRIGHFFGGVGLNLFEGWGLTETMSCVTGNSPASPNGNVVGTAGVALPGAKLRIADDGEIEVFGDRNFDGYWNNEAMTAEALTEDGWLKSGDIGHIDDDGNLHITGRKKDLIITASGKNVAPAPLEEDLRSHPVISEALVVGDRQRFIAALICLDPDVLPDWLENRGLPALSYAEAADHPLVIESIQRAIDRANEKVSRAESIREFRILHEPFNIHDRTLTPSMKVVRPNAVKYYEKEMRSIYGAEYDRHQDDH
ncbi:AMP-dependent synthetase/ligase [Stomatohabitans albus]|uniref:AMP-dependent synthetase/ligase n=1 Tax=Stomatohabitans albus TaxID=3110766 RepID=UPI00300C89D6